jgi:endonuclease/exonuclease/phosphatase family metal-dependent hydrolase
MAKLKVMSFNLRNETPSDGINDLVNRKGKILDVIATEAPDLIGFQEARDGTRAWLRDTLTDYVVVGCGRYADYRGESAPLAFRKDKFEMVSMESFWLSSTPNIPATIYAGSDQSNCPRIATAVVLKPIESESLLLFINTHADHLGAMARTLASAQLLEYMSKKGLPCILTGDFNATPDTTEMKMLTASDAFQMVDATVKLGGTFHGFGTLLTDEYYLKTFGGVSPKIDYIFTNLPTDPDESYAVEDKHEDGIYISDHQPVVAFVEV